MPRVACLHVPDFTLQVALRELGGDPEGGVVVVDPEAKRARVVAASSAARAEGVQPGMRTAAATTLAPELYVRDLDRSELRRSQRALEAAVRSRCPVFERGQPGTLYASWRGLERLYAGEGEGAFLDDLRDCALALGLPARVGMASGRFTAWAAAHMQGRLAGSGPGAISVPDGQERSFLAPLPLALLPDAEALIRRLGKLGVHTLGGFAELPPGGLARRFGPGAVGAWRLARGEDRGKLVPAVEGPELVVGVHAEEPVAHREALLFLLAQPLEELLGRLDELDLAARCLRGHITLDGEEPLQSDVYSSEPSASLKLWRELIKVWVDSLELPAPALSVRVEARELARRTRRQERLLGSREADDEALSVTLAHLVAEVGPDRARVEVPRDHPLPEGRQVGAGAGFPLRLGQRDDGPVPDEVGAGELGAAFRRVDPPEPVRVDQRRGRIAGFRLKGRRYPVESSQGPWDVSTGWWSARATRRRYYLCEGGGHQAQLYLEPELGQWFLAGWID